jgi:release factor glutamine methyltransferase
VAAFVGHPPPQTVLDLGTGTGCLLLAALTEFQGAFGVGVDRSAAAATLAARNAAALGLSNRVTLLCGYWAAALGGAFDLVLCNPPYIPTSDLDGLMPEVARYEPGTALDGGTDGFDAYRSVIPDLPRVLSVRGMAVLEVGIGQADTVATLARQAGLAAEERQDLSGIVRSLLLRRALP